MADISRGRQVQDKDNVGGLRAVYFLAYDETKYNGGLEPTFDVTNVKLIDSFSDLGASDSWYKYDLQGTSTADENLTASRENGTIMTEQTLVLNLKKITTEDQEDIYDLATGRYFILVESKGPNGNDGVLRLFGTRYGCDMTTTAITSGAALGDLAGYAATFVGMEPNPSNITDEGALWATGKQGSLVASDIKTGQTINDVDGSAS